MAADQKSSGAGAPKIKHDEITARIVSDPKSPGGSVLMTGFLGASSEPEHTRIYRDASMGSYIDVNNSDIIHTEPMPKDQSPLGGSYIWLKSTASGGSAGQGGNPMTGRFFEGPLMAAYGTQFGGMAPAGTGVAAGTIAYTVYVACHPTIFCTQLYCPSIAHPCASQLCTRTVIECTGLCPVLTPNCPIQTAFCPVASPGCPPVGPGTPVQGGGGVEAAAMGAQPMAAQAMAAQPMAIPSLICSYAAGCWYSWGACPTQGYCGGPHHTPGCPQLQYQAQPAAAAQPAIAGSYAPHCWYSWGACPTMFGCGPFHTPNCPR